MKKNTIIVIGILGILLIFGAAVALAQNTSSEKTKDAENHECTPVMMEKMSENCPEKMQSGACENMMDGEKGCGEMMDSRSPASNTEVEETDHCADMDSGMGSIMGSSDVDMSGMM